MHLLTAGALQHGVPAMFDMARTTADAWAFITIFAISVYIFRFSIERKLPFFRRAVGTAFAENRHYQFSRSLKTLIFWLFRKLIVEDKVENSGLHDVFCRFL